VCPRCGNSDMHVSQRTTLADRPFFEVSYAGPLIVVTRAASALMRHSYAPFMVIFLLLPSLFFYDGRPHGDGDSLVDIERKSAWSKPLRYIFLFDQL
jgi:hypothetical protein